MLKISNIVIHNVDDMAEVPMQYAMLSNLLNVIVFQKWLFLKFC